MRVILLHLLLLSTFGFAQTKWTGAVDSDWNNPLNWDSIPLNGDSLIIDPANYIGSMQSPNINSGTTFTATCILLKNNSVLTVNDTLVVTGNLYITDNGSLNSLHGIIMVQNDVYIQSGGMLYADSSILDIGNTLHLMDGANNFSSKFFLHSSGAIIHGMLQYKNSLDNYFPSVDIIDGNLRIDGKISVDGLIDNNGQARLKLKNSEAQIYGNIIKDQTNPYSFFIEIADSSEFVFNGTAIYLSSNDSIVISNNSDWKHSIIPESPFSNTHFRIGKFISYDSRTLFTNTPVTIEGNFQFHDLIIDSSGSMGSLSNTKISGDFHFDGWFYSQFGVTMNGAELQHIEGSVDSLEVFWHFNMQNTGDGVILGMDLHIYDFIELIDGILYAPEGNEVYFHDMQYSVNNGNSFIQGYINSNSNFFPLGWENNRYRPLVFPVRNIGEWMRVTYQMASSQTCDINTPLTSVDTIEYWKISPSDSTEEYQLIAGWNDANQSGIGNYSDVTLANSEWNNVNCGWNLVPSTSTNYGIVSGPYSGELTTSFMLSGNQILTFGFTENLYQLDSSACQGVNWIINGSNYNENGTFIDTISADSILMIHLDIIHVDTLVNFDATHIYAHAQSDSCTFRWLNCSTGQEIFGEYESTFSPTENGSYAVIVRNQFNPYCADTSACILIDQIEIIEHVPFNCRIFPNPLHTTNPLQIRSSQLLERVELYDLNNKMIKQIDLDGVPELTINDPHMKTGVYYIKLITVDGIFVYKKLIIYD